MFLKTVIFFIIFFIPGISEGTPTNKYTLIWMPYWCFAFWLPYWQVWVAFLNIFINNNHGSFRRLWTRVSIFHEYSENYLVCFARTHPSLFSSELCFWHFRNCITERFWVVSTMNSLKLNTRVYMLLTEFSYFDPMEQQLLFCLETCIRLLHV